MRVTKYAVKSASSPLSEMVEGLLLGSCFILQPGVLYFIEDSFFEKLMILTLKLIMKQRSVLIISF